MMNPGQAQSAGLGNLVAQRSSIPNDQFVRSATEFVEKTGASPIDMLADTYRRVMAAKNAMMRQGLAAGRMEAQQPRTVAEQLNREALALGIGSQPYGYAEGGLVAFNGGGVAEEETPLAAADIESADLEDAVAEAANSSRLAQLRAQYNAAQQQLEAANKSGDPNAVRYYVAQLQKAKDALEAATISSRPAAAPAAAAPAAAAPAAAVNPTSGTTAVSRTLAVGQGNTAPAAASTRPGAGTRSGAGAGAGGPRPGTTTALPNIAPYTTAAEAAIKGMEGKGRPTPEVLELRKAMLAAQEAEREPRVEYKEPEGMTARELLQLASFDPTKGKWMGSLAEKAAGVLTAREAKAEEFRKLNREIDIANRRLNTALAQQRLAYASTDQKAREDADQAVLNARVALREKVIDFGFKSREIGAKEKGAEAEMIKAGAMKESAGESQKFRKDKELGDAIQEAEQKINHQSMIASPSMTEYLRADSARKEQMIREERFRYVKERAGSFATEAEIRQRMNVAPPASPPAAGAPTLRFDAQGNPIR